MAEVRAITEDELGACFLLPVPAGAVAYRQELYVPGRSLAPSTRGPGRQVH
jgi:hypothetical protein